MSDESLLPHILDLATLDADRMPQDARKMARLSLFDWMVVSLAGADQPLADIIRNFVATEGGVEIAAVTGGSMRLPARAPHFFLKPAALIHTKSRPVHGRESPLVARRERPR